MDRLDMMIVAADAEVDQKGKQLQQAIKRLVELLENEDVTDVAYYNSYIVQAEDVRRFASEVASAKRLRDALEKVRE